MLGSSHFPRTPPLFDSANLMLHPAMMALGTSLTPFHLSNTPPGSYELLQVGTFNPSSLAKIMNN